MRRGISLLAIAGIIALSSSKTKLKDDDIFLDEDYKAGLVNLKDGDDMFYWLFRSKGTPDTDPLVMWLTGGPGCASEVALFYENGPYTIKDDLTLNPNANSWNKISNLLYIDQPIGTGFSKAAKISHYDKTEEAIAANVELFIRGFLEENPEYLGRDFYITGESYAGHYIPAIAYHFVKEVTDLGVNFKGIAIGNGWVDPIIQYPQYAEFAYENKLIGDAEYAILKEGFVECQNVINNKNWLVALEYC